MTRGCLLGVVFLGVLIAGYYFALTPYFEWPGNAIAAGLGGLFAFIFLSGIVGLFTSARNARRLAKAQTQAAGALVDGEIVAIAGTIRPIDAPLQAPFSGTPCVAYDYDIIHYDTRRTSDGSETYEAHDISGLALTPSMIETPTGGVRLLSFGMLDQFPQHAHNNPAARARASAYIANTTFKPMGVTKVFSALGVLNEALTDEDGAVRMDWRMNQGDIALQQATLRERIVPVGQQVSAIGRYSASRRGLIADGMSSMIQLRPGDAKSAQRTLMRTAYSSFGLGLLVFVVSHTILGAALYLSETRYQRESPMSQEMTLRGAVQDRDAEAVRRVLRRGVSPNVRGSHGDTLLHDLRDADMVRVLTKAGADPNLTNDYGSTPLMMAARMGLDDVVTALIEGGASVNIARSDGATALSDAIEGEHPDTVARLQAAGARSDLVTAANGRPLPADGGEPMATVRAYLAAVHARDMKGLNAAFIPRRQGFFDNTDFDLWHRIRPQAPVFAGGFTNGTAATLTISGPTIEKWPIVWHYQLVYKGEVWRIAREWETQIEKPAGPAEPVERPRGH